ncbi:MAG: NAD-dependent epimerase/dehydratase family protein [Pirellulaceae bacterium]|jgi:nucleoside-diphosphate-sugar epimerase|nr:NAD-dependent epimerase/dehydratase family protein [Pirellulaceae bacterium]
MARVLVTGGTGFIGQHLSLRLCNEQHEVRCLVRSEARGQKLREQGAELVVGDLDEPHRIAEAIEGASVVYHLAGMTKSLQPEFMFRVNEAGTAAIAAASARQSPAPTLVVVSSVAAAGPAPRGAIRQETDEPAPVSVYGRSKLAGERAATRYAGQVPMTIVRPGVVFGPGDKAFAKMFAAIRRMRFHASPSFTPPPLSYIHVADLVEILLRAAERGTRIPADAEASPAAGRYFAVAPEYPTYAELGRIVRPMLRRPFAPVIPLAGPVAWCIAGASELVSRLRGQPEEFGFDKLREAFVSSWACSPAAVERDLGFTPPLPLAARLQETIDWYQKSGWL